MKAACRPASQNCPMYSRILFLSLGKNCAWRAEWGRCFNLSCALCVDSILATYGIVAEIVSGPAGSMFSQWEASHRKWPDAPESAIAKVLFWVEVQCT